MVARSSRLVRVQRTLGLLMALILVVGSVLMAAPLFAAQRTIPTLLSDQTVVYASFTPNLSAAANFDKFKQAYSGIIGSGTGLDLDREFKQAFGVDFTHDVQPWIGMEAGAGLIQNVVTTPNGRVPQSKTVIVLAARDAKKATAFMLKVRTAQARDGKYSSKTYKKIKVYTRTPRGAAVDAPFNSMALIKGYVVLGSDLDMVKNVIDRSIDHKGTLAENPHYKAVMAGLPQDAVGHLFVDAKGVDALLGGSPTVVPVTGGIQPGLQRMTSVMTPKLTELKQRYGQFLKLANDSVGIKGLGPIAALDEASASPIEGFGVAASLLDTGLAFDSAVKLDLSKLSPAQQAQLNDLRQPVSNELLKTIGQEAFAVLSGRLPANLKQDLLDAINSDPQTQQTVQEFEQKYQLSIEHDLLDWLQGEYAIAAVPADQTKGLMLPATAYLQLRTPALEQAVQGLRKFEPALLDQINNPDGSGPRAAFEDRSFGGQNWRTLVVDGQVMAGYAAVGQDIVIGIDEAALAAMPQGAQHPLTADAAFQGVTGKLPEQNSGLFFLDLRKLIGIVAQVSGQTPEQLYSDPSLKLLQPIQAVGAAGKPGYDDQGLATSRLFALYANN